MSITEERLFSPTGQLMASTKTPKITNLRTFRLALGTKVAGISFHRYDGKRGGCFLLYDGRIVIVILGREGEPLVAASSSNIEGCGAVSSHQPRHASILTEDRGLCQKETR
jgi:hypothetical protein